MWATQKIKRLSGKIKKNWAKLSDEEIAFYQEKPDAFYNAVKIKYCMHKDDVERRVQQLKSANRFF